MGRKTRNFRQTRKSGSGKQGNQNYAKINRLGGWGKIFNVFKKG